jgi:hypothetical protein
VSVRFVFPEVTVTGFPPEFFARDAFPNTRLLAALVTAREALVFPVVPLLLAFVPPEEIFITPK